MAALFNEWVLFDFPFRRGKTPLECFVASPPKSLAPSLVNRLDQAARTHFSTDFWLVSADATTHILLLERCDNGERYPVLDFTASSQLSGQSAYIGTRLAKVSGSWILPGNPVFISTVRPTDRLKKAIREDSPDRPTRFIDLIRQRFGHKDEEEVSQFHAPDPMTDDPGEIAERLARYKRTICEMEPSTSISWEMVCRTIELGVTNEELGPIDALERLTLPKEGDEPSFDSRQDVSTFFDAFANTWVLAMGGVRLPR